MCAVRAHGEHSETGCSPPRHGRCGWRYRARAEEYDSGEGRHPETRRPRFRNWRVLHSLLPSRRCGRRPGARFAPRPRVTEEEEELEWQRAFTHAAAGVHRCWQRLGRAIKPWPRRHHPGLRGESSGLGAFDLEKAGFGGPDVLLVSGTDGVGKLTLAQRASLIGDTRTKEGERQPGHRLGGPCQ